MAVKKRHREREYIGNDEVYLLGVQGLGEELHYVSASKLNTCLLLHSVVEILINKEKNIFKARLT